MSLMIASVMPIKWKLKDALVARSITPHALAVHIGMQPANMYRLLRGDGPHNIDRVVLSRIIHGLRFLSSDPKINVQDILEEEPKHDEAT